MSTVVVEVLFEVDTCHVKQMGKGKGKRRKKRESWSFGFLIEMFWEREYIFLVKEYRKWRLTLVSK